MTKNLLNPSYFISILRSSLGVMTSRVFGLIRDVAIAAVYGASSVTDMFFVAFAIPNLFRQFFAEGAIASAFLPFLSDKTQHHGKKAANAYLTQLILVQVGIISIISIILILFARYVILLFLPGYAGDQDTILVGAAVLKIVTPYLLFVSINGLLAGYLNLNHSYYVAYASTAWLNIMMIAGAVVGYYMNGNIYSLALSVFAGGFFQLLTVLIYANLKGFRFESLKPADPDVKATYKLLIPSLAGVGISQLNFLVGRIIASFLQHGSISWLFYANRLFQFPLGIFSVAISTVGLTELSKARTNGDTERVEHIINKSVIAVLFIMIPATIGLVGLSQEITELIYARKAFTEIDAINTSKALQMYSIGLVFYSFVGLFTRVFHSDKNTKFPVKAALVGFIVNVVFNLILMKNLGHSGIALASTIAAFVNAIILYAGIRGYRFNIRANAALLLKIIVSSYLVILCLWLCKYFGMPVLVSIIYCVVVYLSALILMKVDLIRLFR